MKRALVVSSVLLWTGVAFADPVPAPTPAPAKEPTVTLTLNELNAIINWQIQAAKAKDESDKADGLKDKVKSVLDRITEAVAPPKKDK